jgi:hypothetical protein
MKTHPSEADLALFAGNDNGALSRFRLGRHVRQCAECEQKVAEFQSLRSGLGFDLPAGLDWNRLAAEMRANIRLGLEAGECVRTSRGRWRWNPRIAVACASLLLLLGAGFVLHSPLPQPASAELAGPVLESTGSGLELRTGSTSLMLLNHHGAVADQTVSAQGEIRARYIDAGAVTINNVSF